jgi:RHS repeat-associated protein
LIGKTIAYGYDAQNRLTSKSFVDGTKVTYSYTFNGLQDKVTFLSATGAVTAIYDYDYDVRDRLIKRTDTIDGVARAIEYGYDIGSNRTSVTTASGTTTYTYDERNRLDLVKQNGVLAADYDYDAISNLTQTTFGNGTRENRNYDTLNRLTTLETKRLGDNTPLSKYVYTLDKVGNRKSVTETQNGQGRSITYTYDDLYRLTKESIVDSVNSDRTSTYVYDKVGNRLGKTVNGVITAYVYDGNDRLLNEKVNGTAIVTYGYDNNGSTIAKTENGLTSTYVWNDDKRLVSATVNGKAIGYTYNDQGIRVSSIVDGVETRYLLDEGITANVWEEYSPNGMVQASYVYGNDLILQDRSGVSSFYLVDGLGSTRLLTDSQGQVLNAYGYEAFGETVSQSGTATNAYQYAGEQFDGAIGDYYLRQRFYDTSSGRFGRMDIYGGSQQQPLSLNKYVYTQENPINGVDPTGYFTMFDALSVISGLTGLAGLYIMSNTIPFYTTDKSKGLSLEEGMEIEKRVLQYSLQLAEQDSNGSALQFSMLMDYTARQIKPTQWVNNKRIRSDYLKIAYDMFTEEYSKGDWNIFGFLGDSGPRSHGRPYWLTQHADDYQDWQDYYPNDLEESKALGIITGRRDHFLTNSLVGFPVGNLTEKYLLNEKSDNDLMVNRLGRAFGIGVASGSISQYGIGGWISSNM